MRSGCKPKTHRVLVVSDTHCGSTTALCPPDFETIEGHRVRLSEWQSWVWDQWRELTSEVKKCGRIDSLIINGDAIEGIHHRTVEVWSPDPADHVNAAHHCLQPLAELAERVYVVKGTSAHTGPSSEHGLALRLGAVACRPSAPAFDRLDLDIGGVQCRFVHHMPTTGREWLKGNALGMELANHQLAEGRQGRPMPRVLGLAHRHVFGLYHDSAGLSFVTPSWQGPTRFTYKVAPAATWEVGAMMLECTEGICHAKPFLRRPKP